MDWEIGHHILFGDGAGAAVLQASDRGRGVMPAVMGSDGALADLLWTPGGGSRNPISHGWWIEKSILFRCRVEMFLSTRLCGWAMR